ncbi:hypothetical protein B0H15DRAFT_805368 [Mycena belliarum]|uniref:Uncharacterized protein n=1 Tax=Mycena belliarum TaxID=1033014 RepID=A0AAD6TTE9_9AGAR|nr:hypothetical protein B0H15DRAFT_805368 [Mycena belliae]
MVQPNLPEDIEREVTEVLLNEATDMCGAMSLVAPRFNTWTKPVKFGTIVVREHNDWKTRLSEVLLPNARFIQRLAVMVECNRPDGSHLPDADLAQIKRLLEASIQVKHLAVVWSIWARLPRECGKMHLESLYLEWDEDYCISPPTLRHLQYPDELKDITVYAPLDLDNPPPHWRAWGEFYLPDTTHCTNLAYVTYAALATPGYSLGALSAKPNMKGVMFVLVDIPEDCLTGDNRWKREEKLWPAFSGVYLRYPHQILGEWLARMEGMPSTLDHPPPHYVEVLYDDEGFPVEEL